MNAKFQSIFTFLAAPLAAGADAPPPEFVPDAFRYVRTERKTFPPIVQGGRTIAPSVTNTYGVFAFRYSNPKPFAFWGFSEPQGKKFITRFTDYRIRKKSSWERLPTGYCGTGAMTFALQPGVDYELFISLSYSDVSKGSPLRVSANCPSATFWSEPFICPMK